MENENVYIALDQSVLVHNRDVQIGDIASVFCLNKDISYKVSKTKLLHFNNTEQDQSVVSVLKIIEQISTDNKNVTVNSIGSPETIVYYKNSSQIKELNNTVKIILMMIFAFFGSSFSIMAYNNDTGTAELIKKLYTQITGNPSNVGNESDIGMVVYSIGLCIGMILFFNHGINKSLVDDPTPLQVQMRLYEQEVNQCIITDCKRHASNSSISPKEYIDVK